MNQNSSSSSALDLELVRPDRKPLLLVGSLGQALMLGIMAVIFGTAAQGAPGILICRAIRG